jgi:hypothetical protein
MTPRRVALFFALLLTNGAFAQRFDWEPGTVRAEMRRNDKLKLGQYLYISRNSARADDDNSEDHWNMAKLDVPENWKVKEIRTEKKLIVVVTNLGIFKITPDNLYPLFRALTSGDQPKSDDELENIWKQLGALESTGG